MLVATELRPGDMATSGVGEGVVLVTLVVTVRFFVASCKAGKLGVCVRLELWEWDKLELWDGTKLESWDWVKLKLWEWVKLELWEGIKLELWDWVKLELWEWGKLELWEWVKLELWEWVKLGLWEDKLELWDGGQPELWDKLVFWVIGKLGGFSRDWLELCDKERDVVWDGGRLVACDVAWPLCGDCNDIRRWRVISSRYWRSCILRFWFTWYCVGFSRAVLTYNILYRISLCNCFKLLCSFYNYKWYKILRKDSYPFCYFHWLHRFSTTYITI